jgi:hypothetical protein
VLLTWNEATEGGKEKEKNAVREINQTMEIRVLR